MLRLEGLTAGYDSVPVLHGINLEVGAAESVALVGPNGAGKSTLVRTVSGLVRPFSGRLMKDDVDLAEVPAHRRVEHGFAFVLENRNLFTELTVRDNLRLSEAAGRRAKHDHQRFELREIFELFPVVQERYHARVELLSGGQQQMVAIARALLLQPNLLIMDELTTGLAPKVVKEILGVLSHLRQRGMSILLVEQSIGIASEMTDRAYVMSVGRVVHVVQRGEWQKFLNDETLVQAYLHG